MHDPRQSWHPRHESKGVQPTLTRPQIQEFRRAASVARACCSTSAPMRKWAFDPLAISSQGAKYRPSSTKVPTASFSRTSKVGRGLGSASENPTSSVGSTVPVRGPISSMKPVACGTSNPWTWKVFAPPSARARKLRTFRTTDPCHWALKSMGVWGHPCRACGLNRSAHSSLKIVTSKFLKRKILPRSKRQLNCHPLPTSTSS